MKFLARLYPRQWRERYGEEFSALLEDIEPGWRDSIDIVKGALVMQMSGWNAGRTLVVGGMLGAVISFGISFAIPRQYVSQAVIKITPEPGLPSLVPDSVKRGMTDRINSLSQTILSNTRLYAMINSFALYKNERSRMPIEDVIEIMRRNIQIQNVPIAGQSPYQGRVPAFVVQFTHENRYVAQRVTQDLVSQFMYENVHNPNGIGTTLLLLDPASLPQNPVSPRVPIIVTVGLIGGLALGGIIALTRRPRKRASVFEGTSVPFRALVDSIESGKTLDQFLTDFPTVTKDAAVSALRQLSAAG